MFLVEDEIEIENLAVTPATSLDPDVEFKIIDSAEIEENSEHQWTPERWKLLSLTISRKIQQSFLGP